MSHLAFDLRDVSRSLRHDIGYAATVILTLALTLGATTAVFSIVDGVLLKPLAYRESQRLVSVKEVWRQFQNQAPSMQVNGRHFEYWRTHAGSFQSLAQYFALPAKLTGSGEAARITVVHASASLFDVLRVEPSRGRALAPADESSGSPDVAVVTDAFWRQRLSADPAIVGRSIVLDGRPHTIVGVLPPRFQLPDAGGMIDNIDAVVAIRIDMQRVGWVGDHNNAAVGRLKKGITLDEAHAELDVLQMQVSAIATAAAHEPVTLASVVVPLTDTVVGRARQGLFLLLGAIVAVLLIACSNLANLSLTRTIGRQRESAIRLALGAGRRRLTRLAVLEQLALAVTGGAVGVFVAWAALVAFVRTAPIDLPRASDVALDGRVLGFATAISVVAGLLVAALPAWRTAHSDPQSALRASGIATTTDRGATRARSMLLAMQAGLSVVLLVVTAELSLSLVRLAAVDRGFTSDRVLVVGVALPASRYEDDGVPLAVYDRLLASVRALPGVESATTTSMLPLSGQGQVNFVKVEGDTRPRSELATANFRFVGPEFFRTLAVPIVRGRTFTDGERDPSLPAPVLVSSRTAARLWPAADAIGKRFSRGETGEQGFEVVGVVADARTTSLETVPPLMVYVPYWWRSRTSTTLLLKAASDPASLLPAVRRAVRNIDPEIAIGQSRPMDLIVEAAFAARRYQVRLFVVFGVVALLIAVIGVYATTAYGVSRRRREMNIRAALGAPTSQVIGLAVRQGSLPILIGALAGAAGALAIGGIVASLLFDVRSRDPLLISTVAATVGVIGLVACLVSARHSLVINPASALREE